MQYQLLILNKFYLHYTNKVHTLFEVFWVVMGFRYGGIHKEMDKQLVLGSTFMLCFS